MFIPYYNMMGPRSGSVAHTTSSFIQPKPAKEWPVPIKALKIFSRKEDRGIGDTIARVVGPIGGEAYKRWHLREFGKPCGCSERQQRLNQKYPLIN